VTGATTSRYRVAWTNAQNMLEEWHNYTSADLQAGVNLVDDFQLNPFSYLFHRIDDLIFQKQNIESGITWHGWEAEAKSAEAGLAEYEARRVQLLNEIKQSFVPVTHNIRIEAIV